MMLPLLLALSLVPAVASGVDITACGQGIQPGEVGELRADVTCDLFQIIHVAGGGTLNLNGFAIVGQGIGGGVECSGIRSRGEWCTINGPGEIRSFEVAITGGGGRLRVQGVTLRLNRWGLTYKAGRLIELTNVVATDNDIGLSVRGGRVRGRDIEASRNRTAGISMNAITEFVRLTAVGNGAFGGIYTVPFSPRHVTRLVDSTIVGNDGLGMGFDVLSTGRVKLVNTTCGRGARIRVTRNAETITVRRRLGCADD